MTGPDSLARVAEARSALFVPGDRPERFAKAAASGADLVIIDLEDAVAAGAKATALLAACKALDEGFTALVRINTPGSPAFDADLAALAGPGCPPGLLGIMVPKVENASVLREVGSALGPGRAVVALIESARGVRDIEAITAAAPCTRLAFGAIDFSLDTGGTTDPAVLAPVRSRLVIASRAAGMASPLDTPCTNFQHAPTVEAEARHGRSFGFGGKLCIHPAQIAPVHAAFAPTPDEIEWAMRILNVDAAAEGAAAKLDGHMVDAPVVARARGIISTSNERQRT